MNNNDLQDIKIIKELGAGVFGTTYLAKINNKKYALKIQHILPSHRKKSFKSDLWREMDLYDFINTLPKKDQQFFTKLYYFEIYDNCDHVQKRTQKLPDKGPWAKKIKNLNSSPYCVKYITDYHGDLTLARYLETSNVSLSKKYSIMLQLIKIMMILYKNGYSHNDLHPGNVMIKKTKEKYFEFENHKIPFEGIQCIAIDYGEVLHDKFKMKLSGFQKSFQTDKKEHLFKEMVLWLFLVIDNIPKLIYDCEKQNKKIPWDKKNSDEISDKAIKSIMIYHPTFYHNISTKYEKLYPGSKKLFDLIYNNRNNSTHFEDLIKNNKNTDNFWSGLRRLQYEFAYYYPEQYAKYFGWCSVRKINLPEKNFRQLMDSENYQEVINSCLNAINKLPKK